MRPQLRPAALARYSAWSAAATKAEGLPTALAFRQAQAPTDTERRSKLARRVHLGRVDPLAEPLHPGLEALRCRPGTDEGTELLSLDLVQGSAGAAPLLQDGVVPIGDALSQHGLPEATQHAGQKRLVLETGQYAVGQPAHG